MTNGVVQEPFAWEAGYQAGLSGSPSATPPGLDGLSFISGYIEGQAARTQQDNRRILDILERRFGGQSS